MPQPGRIRPKYFYRIARHPEKSIRYWNQQLAQGCSAFHPDTPASLNVAGHHVYVDAIDLISGPGDPTVGRDGLHVGL